MKITILGDIMCEPPVRKTYRQKDGSYNFDGLFANVKGLLSEADYHRQSGGPPGGRRRQIYL